MAETTRTASVGKSMACMLDGVLDHMQLRWGAGCHCVKAGHLARPSVRDTYVRMFSPRCRVHACQLLQTSFYSDAPGTCVVAPAICNNLKSPE